MDFRQKLSTETGARANPYDLVAMGSGPLSKVPYGGTNSSA